MYDLCACSLDEVTVYPSSSISTEFGSNNETKASTALHTSTRDKVHGRKYNDAGEMV